MAEKDLHTPAPAAKVIDVAVAVVFDRASGEVLICKRKPDTVLGGYWEFPGGKCDPGETPESCAVREVLEETSIAVTPLKQLPVIEHHYPHAHVRLHPVVCERQAGDIQLLAVEDAQWIDPAKVVHYRFPEANHALMQVVAKGYGAVLGKRI